MLPGPKTKNVSKVQGGQQMPKGMTRLTHGFLTEQRGSHLKMTVSASCHSQHSSASHKQTHTQGDHAKVKLPTLS